MRLDQVRLARPYANALFSIAQTPEALENWSRYLSCLMEIVEHPNVSEILRFPSKSLSDKKDLLKSLWSSFVKDLPISEANRLIDVLVDNNRLMILSEFINALKKLRDENQHSYKAIVEGAYPISSEDESQIKVWLEKQLSKKVYIEYHLNPALMSGIKAQVGDECVYASTEHLLLRLSETLKRG